MTSTAKAQSRRVFFTAMMDDDLEKAVELHEEGKYEDSIKLLKQSAESQHPLALYLYALHLREGWGCDRDQAKAFQILQEAVNVLCDKLSAQTAECKPVLSTKEMEDQKEVESNIPKEKRFDSEFRRHSAVERPKCDPSLKPRQSITHRSQQLLDRISSANNRQNPRLVRTATQMSLAKQATRRELVPLTIFELGICYFYGWGVRRACNIGIFYIDIAASLGDSQAQNFLGNVYERGLGVKKSKFQAAKYYRMDQASNEIEKPWIMKAKYNPKSSNIVEEGSLAERLKSVPAPEKRRFGFLEFCFY
jgi:tetratricopeptide (TPR) repeat protein